VWFELRPLADHAGYVERWIGRFQPEIREAIAIVGESCGKSSNEAILGLNIPQVKSRLKAKPSANSIQNLVLSLQVGYVHRTRTALAFHICGRILG
jgi:hypothetical protein